MGLRYRKSVKIAPGVKLNFSKSGVGVSVGTKGARMSISPKGRVTQTLGIPGTGISYVTTSSINKKKKSKPTNTVTQAVPQKVPKERQANKDVPKTIRQAAPIIPLEKLYTKKQFKMFSIMFMVAAIIIFIMGILLIFASVPIGLISICIGIFTFHMSKKYKQLSEDNSTIL